MKNLFLLTTTSIILSLWSENACARSWRINSNPDAKAHFKSINAAMESLEVFNGDTLYLDPGCIITEQVTIDKSVTIIGTGYNLDGTSIKEAMITGAYSTVISADNVKIEGCSVENIEHHTGSNIEIERCRILNGVNCSGNGNLPLKIRSCFIDGIIKCGSYNSSYNVEISNCIVRGRIQSLSASTITNNVIITQKNDGYDKFLLSNIKESSITNNIIINTETGYKVGDNQTPYYYKNSTIENTTTTDNNTISRNVLSTEAAHAFANYPDNKYIGATLEDVFILEGVSDAMYKLKEGSPAIGYGTNGYDCGAFSGPYPYVISGHPRFIPYIYEAIIPNQPTDGKLNITLKIKSQNE